MTQFSRPNSDLAGVGSSEWMGEDGSTTNIYTHINKVVPNDATFIETASTSTQFTYKAGMSAVTDPQTTANHVLKVRYRRALSNTDQADITFKIQMANGTDAVVRTFTSISNTIAEDDHTLTAAEVNLITGNGGYANMRFTAVANFHGSILENLVYVTWVELDVPDAPAPTPPPLQISKRIIGM